MGGCQTTSDSIETPKKLAFPLDNNKIKLERHKFVLPPQLELKFSLASSNGKVTDLVTNNSLFPIRMSYEELDVGNNLDSNNKFYDKEFGNEQKHLGFKSVSEEVTWKRPSEFMKENYSVFEGQIEPRDIKQGKLGNCYFLSALAGISEYPFVVRRIFETTEQSSYGAYGIWLFIDGLWKCIIIDDRIPVCNGEPIFSKGNNNEIWVMLIEKAYAKVFGSYEIIESGLTGVGMNALTGAPFEYLCKDSENKINPSSAWDFINTHLSMNHLLTGSTENNDRNGNLGLVSAHAYTILDCQEVQVPMKKGKKTERILQISNPWGRYEWKGRWGEESDVWTEELKEKLKYVRSDDGIFWIGLEDFLENFGQICVCKYNKNYINSSLPLKFSETENDYKCIFLKTTNRIEGYINLYQKDHRFFYGSTYEYSLVRVIIMEIDKASRTLKRYVNDMMDCDREASFHVQLDPGDYYLIVEMDWKNNFTREAVINFYGQQSVNFVEDLNPPEIEQLFNEVVVLHESHTEQERIYNYEKDEEIKRVTGSLAGYVYYHYSNKSKNGNYLCESVSLKEKKFIEVHGENNANEFVVKVCPDEEKIIKLKVQKEGNSFYSFSTKIQFYIVEKFPLEKLRELADKKPTKVKKREIESKEIDVYIKSYNYSGGVAILYQNKMDKYAYVEELGLEIENLELENEDLPKNKKLEIELEPLSEKLLSFVVCSPGKEIVFRTKVAFYLNSPEFKF